MTNVNGRPAPVHGPRMARWELGSDFDLMMEAESAAHPWTRHPHSLWGSGRDAIRGLFEWGARTRGWRRLLMPSYFCQDVVGATRRSVEVQVYPWSPLEERHEPVATEDGDVVFVSAMFGAQPKIEVRGAAPIIEDHSHDLLASWAVQSRADYAIASLRKTLPLPDGGIVWSPRDLEVPPELDMTAHHAWAVAQRLSAMILKRHYLQGDDISKQDFRDVGLEGERMMASGPNTGISAFSRARLPTLPTERWRSRRAENLAEFRDALGATPGIRLLEVPFSAMLVFDDAAIRTTVRQALIAHDIYPSVLWPMDHQAVEGIPHAHVEASRRLLSLHVDHRYGTDDMRRAAAILHHAMDAG